MDAFGLSFYIMKAGFTSSEKKWRIISAARSSDGRSKGDIDLQCFGPTGGYASRDPSTGEGTRQHVDPSSLTELCILRGFPAFSILRFPDLLPSSSMHAAVERFRLFAHFSRSLSLSLSGGRTPFFLLSLSGSGTTTS
jgi:hypothetical protein